MLSSQPSSKILSIDTCTDACSVAISINGEIHEHYEVAPQAHARLILARIDSLLKKMHCTLADMDAFAFSRGPGSFTGVRIGCSVIQALGFGFNKPIVPVSTLRALAQGAYQEQGFVQVFAYLDARMNEVYWGLFELGAHNIMHPVSEERVQPMDAVVLPEGHWQSVTGYPHAAEVARIAEVEFRLGHTVTAEFAVPVYVRDEVAKKS